MIEQKILLTHSYDADRYVLCSKKYSVDEILNIINYVTVKAFRLTYFLELGMTSFKDILVRFYGFQDISENTPVFY